MPKVEVFYANISQEENLKRIKELENVLSTILKTKVKLIRKDSFK